MFIRHLRFVVYLCFSWPFEELCGMTETTSKLIPSKLVFNGFSTICYHMTQNKSIHVSKSGIHNTHRIGGHKD